MQYQFHFVSELISPKKKAVTSFFLYNLVGVFQMAIRKGILSFKKMITS